MTDPDTSVYEFIEGPARLAVKAFRELDLGQREELRRSAHVLFHALEDLDSIYAVTDRSLAAVARLTRQPDPVPCPGKHGDLRGDPL